MRGDLYELCRGDVPGRTDPDAITLFENGGGGHLDLMTASVPLAALLIRGFRVTEASGPQTLR